MNYDTMVFIVPLPAEAAPKLPCGFLWVFLRGNCGRFQALHSCVVVDSSAVRYYFTISCYDIVVSGDKSSLQLLIPQQFAMVFFSLALFEREKVTKGRFRQMLDFNAVVILLILYQVVLLLRSGK